MRWRVREPFAPHKQRIRMAWNAFNVYALEQKKLPALSKLSVYQQQWIAKKELRAYHVPNITEKQFLDRHFSLRFPLQNLSAEEREGLGKQGGPKAIPPMQSLMFGELERRLDVVVFRSHFVKSIFDARRWVGWGEVKVNGEVCRYPARRLDDGDIVTVSPKIIPTLKWDKVSEKSSAKVEGVDSSDKPAPEQQSADATTTKKKSKKSKALEPLPKGVGQFSPVPYMSPWMFIPSYLEVDYATCSTVFLRSPLPQPGRVEIPSPFPPEWHQLAYEWYAGIRKRKTRTPPPVKPLVINGQAVRLKRGFDLMFRNRRRVS